MLLGGRLQVVGANREQNHHVPWFEVPCTASHCGPPLDSQLSLVLQGNARAVGVRCRWRRLYGSQW